MRSYYVLLSTTFIICSCYCHLKTTNRGNKTNKN